MLEKKLEESEQQPWPLAHLQNNNLVQILTNLESYLALRLTCSGLA